MIRDSIEKLTCEFLGNGGIVGIYDDVKNGIETIIVEIIPGNVLPVDLPTMIDGFPIYVKLGRPIVREMKV